VASELIKNRYNNAQEPSLGFFRDSAGHEIDFVLDDGAGTRLLEVLELFLEALPCASREHTQGVIVKCRGEVAWLGARMGCSVPVTGYIPISELFAITEV